MALILGTVQDFHGASLFGTIWCQILDLNAARAHTLAAQAHRELGCRGLHAEAIRAAAGAADVEREKWIVDGDAVCTHRFRRPRPPPARG